jgi:predicted NAD/FAD-dependent oxidoreductase
VVIATEAGGAERLLGRSDPPAHSNGVTCLYFTAPSAPVKPACLRKGLYQCGDHCGIASIDTSLASGTAAAEAVLEDLP